VAFINKKDRANFAFKKWLENSIRNNFWFVWTPIVIRFKEKSRDNE
jgi:predicted GTPase